MSPGCLVALLHCYLSTRQNTTIAHLGFLTRSALIPACCLPCCLLCCLLCCFPQSSVLVRILSEGCQADVPQPMRGYLSPIHPALTAPWDLTLLSRRVRELIQLVLMPVRGVMMHCCCCMGWRGGCVKEVVADGGRCQHACGTASLQVQPSRALLLTLQVLAAVHLLHGQDIDVPAACANAPAAQVASFQRAH